MKMKKRIHLVFVCLTFLDLCTQGIAAPKRHHVKEKTQRNKTGKNVPRSALVAIHPEDLKLHAAKPREVQGSRKSGFSEVNLQTMEESQAMNALSGKLTLPAGEERIIKDFLKDMERSHGELTPSVMKKMVRIGAYQPFQRFLKSRAQNLQGTQRSLDLKRPTLALPFKLGGNTETFTNTESDIGEQNTAYNSNPLPEYNYKERTYNLATTVDNDYHGNDYHDNDLHGDDYHDNDLHGSDSHENYFNGNDFHDSDIDYSKAFDQISDKDFGTIPDGGDDDENRMAGIGSVVGKKEKNLINEISRKVLLNILEKQNEEKTQKLSGKEVPDLLGAAENEIPAFTSETTNSVPTHKATENTAFTSETTNSIPTHKATVVPSSVNSLTDLFKSNRASHEIASALTPSGSVASGLTTSGLASQNIAQFLQHLGLSTTKTVTQEAQTPVESTLNSKIPNDQNTPAVRNIDIGGKVNNVIDVARVTTPITTTPTSRASNVAMTTSTVGRKKLTQENNDFARNDDVVVLKISGHGKPVSFNADTTNDGSLVLKIPKKFSEKIIQPNGNQATDSKNNGADAHPGDLSADVIKLLAGKAGKSSLLGDQVQISDWEISGKQDKENKNTQTAMVDLHPTRNVLPITDTKLSLPSLSSLLQSPSTQSEPKTLVQAPQSVLPSTAGLTVQKELGNLADTPHNLIQSVFPNLAGLPPSAQNIEQLMTLLTHMDQLPSTQVGVTAYSGTIPTNYAVRQDVDKGSPLSLKGVLKASELVEDSGVARNKGIKTEKDKEIHNDWSPCTVTCGEGIQARARPCQGKYCSGFTTESRPCNDGSCPEQLAKSGLELQNKFRGWHHSPALKWSSSLAKKAQKLADDLALNNDSLVLSAEMKELPGENLAVINQGYETSTQTAARQWYGEVKGYSFTHPSLEDSTRHFTQVVWKDTKKAGIGVAKSKSSEKTYVVALYDPPGNVEGQERKNIKVPDMTQA